MTKVVKHAGKVCLVSVSCESGRPYVRDEYLPGVKAVKIFRIATRQASAKGWTPPKLQSSNPHPRATEYDFYDGARGIVSARAREVLEPFAVDYFEFLDATLYGKPYFFLRIKKTM